MRILHLNNEKTWRGGERQTLLLAAELQARGIENVIGCRAGAPLEGEAKARKMPVLIVPAGNLALLLKLRSEARKFDLIHCHTGRGHSVAAVNAIFCPTPMIVTRRVDFRPSRSWFNRFKYSKAAKVVCISRFIAEQMRQWGVPEARIAVIPSTVPLPAHAVPKEKVRAQLCERLGISPSRKLVGNIAALVGHKDQATLLRAAREVANADPEVAFVIVGEGELRRELETQRRQLRLEQTVYLAGFIPEAERLLPAFDVFTMSSKMEGLGSIVLDAFAAGVPVAATAGGGLPELVRHRETGLLAPIGDHQALAQTILELLRDRSLALQVSERARQLVEREFSVAGMADRYLEIYMAVLAT